MDVTELKQEVRKWLKDSPKPLTQWAVELDVSYFWLQRFVKGRIENIGTDRLQFLLDRMNADKAPRRRGPQEARPN